MPYTIYELFEKTATDGAGVQRWISNNNTVPEDVQREAGVAPSIIEATQAARQADLVRLVKRMRAAEEAMTPEQKAEEAYEMRAAFGPGETIVNAFTGRVTRT